MRWLADECVDAALVRRLRGAGHDVIYAAEVASGATDAQILRRANDEHRLLLTEDKDFGEFVFRLHMTVPGLRAFARCSGKISLQMGPSGRCRAAVWPEVVWALRRHRGSSFPVAAAAGLDTGALGPFCYRKFLRSKAPSIISSPTARN